MIFQDFAIISQKKCDNKEFHLKLHTQIYEELGSTYMIHFKKHIYTNKASLYKKFPQHNFTDL